MRLPTKDGDDMKTRISALADGELEGHEVFETLRALQRNPELRGEWCDCHLIGAALRGERKLDIDVAARVMSALELEPTVMAPAQRSHLEWRRPALALAASAAGVALVAWLALAPTGEGVPERSARQVAAGQGQVVANSQSTPRLKEYLVAHQAYSSGGTMVGGARNIRTVAASDERR